ncbi:MAG: NAD(P)-dependent oxidoreductase [Herpetosiphon sp.]
MQPPGPTPTISVLGLGMMGRRMLLRLADAGYTVQGWNRSVLSTPLAVPVTQDLERVVEAELCVLMLSDSEAVEQVLGQIEPRLARGQMILDMGTSDPRHSRRHAARLKEQGIGWVDAPVSGGPEGAEQGSLAIMVGGSVEDVERVWPVLQVLGGNVVHAGDAGAGHTAKVINQLIVGLTIEAVAEAMVLAEGCGIEPRLVQQCFSGGFADSKVLQIHGTRMIERRYVPGGKVRTQLKDLRLAEELAQEAGVTLPHLASVTQRYAALMADGADLDHSAIHRLIDPAAQVSR